MKISDRIATKPIVVLNGEQCGDDFSLWSIYAPLGWEIEAKTTYVTPSGVLNVTLKRLK